jgi:mannose-binding lectin 1
MMKILLRLSLFAAAVAGQAYIVERSSFGHGQSVSSDKVSIPNWRISGEGHTPQLLSDRLILTPPYPGNRRGAVWAEAKNSLSEWTAAVDFRATGPERGGGNLHIWYTKDGQSDIGTSSIYTVRKFDGLVLVVDMYGGRGGSVRGFMNDGTIDFKNHHSVDSLAFGHCDFAYRNLGRPSTIQIKQGPGKFEVIIENRPCFSTDKITLPSDYSFGISAASAETADSFEIFKFVLSTTSSTTREEPTKSPPQNAHAAPEDAKASTIVSQESQFADLHDRLQNMAHVLDGVYEEVVKLSLLSEGRHQEIARNFVSGDKLNAMDQKLQSIETTVQGYQQQFLGLQKLVRDSHSRLTVGLPQHMSEIISTKSPRMGFLLFIFISFQLLLAGSYVVYKRRRANAPKKYL